jgi:hypothetical protein
MPTRDQLTRARIEAAEKAGRVTSEIVRSLQAAGYSLVLDWVVGNIETDGNRITYSAKNLGKVQGLYRLLAKFQTRYQGTMLGSVLEWTGKIVGLNQAYFESFETVEESVQDAARRLTLQRWGYNTATKELIAGGYMEGLFSNQDTARKVASLVNQAIIQKIPLSQFQTAFRRAFVGKPGEGMMERHWKTNSYDLFQKIDRTANLVYADRLGLNYAIYSGTIMETSRPFCRARVNKVFSRPEIKGWEGLTFAGKPKFGYDPFADCGGFQCRHHLSWVSDGVAQHLRPELKQKNQK